MTYPRGSALSQGQTADFRGPFGFGRRSHGSDPNAHYEFHSQSLPVIPSTIVPVTNPENECGAGAKGSHRPTMTSRD